MVYMTKQALKARLDMMGELYAAIDGIRAEIEEAITATHDDVALMPGILDGIGHGDPEKKAKRAYSALAALGCLDGLEDGPEVEHAAFKRTPRTTGSAEISLPLPDGGRLAAYTMMSDFGTAMAGAVYYDKDGYPIDLAMADMKRGGLAGADGLPADNEDIDLMVWSDVFDESYREKWTLSHADIMERAATD